MAAENYQKCLAMILHHEGGYVTHPKDPGGMTNLGVTKRVQEEWVGYAVSENTMQNLTNEDVSPIYKKIIGIESREINCQLDQIYVYLTLV